MNTTEPISARNSAFDVLRSALVVPVVVGLVILLAWGLVRFSEGRQDKSGRPEPQPVVKSSDGSLALQIPFAQVNGQLTYRGRSKPTIARWNHLDEVVAWRFSIESPGRYRVEIELACAPEDAGSKVRIELAGERLEATVPATAGSDDFKTVSVGEINVPSPGWQVLRIVPESIKRDAVMVLRGVRLVPKS